MSLTTKRSVFSQFNAAVAKTQATAALVLDRPLSSICLLGIQDLTVVVSVEAGYFEGGGMSSRQSNANQGEVRMLAWHVVAATPSIYDVKGIK